MRGEQPVAGARPREHAVLYCLVPADLGPKLHGLLRAHFRDDPSVDVVVEQRGRDRRSGAERRMAEEEPPAGAERRRVRAATGRRVGERRAALVPRDEMPPLPLRARRFAARLTFVERLEPSTQTAEDLDTARLVGRFQAGDREIFSTLYTRYFNRVYLYLRVLLRDTHEAEDATQQVFLKLFELLPRYERRGVPFRAWLFTLVRNHAVDQLRKQSRIDVLPSDELPQAEELASTQSAGELEIMNWLSDRDLQIFVERLPLAQRRVLVMRYLLGFSVTEIAVILDKKPNAVSALQHRALRMLEERLRAVGRGPATRVRGERSRSRRWVRQATVLRSRRFALTKF